MTHSRRDDRLDDLIDGIEPGFWEGVDQFNQQQFYLCHDTLEAIWMEAGEPQKKFYQGVLQIAVALYHLSNQNLRGAMILLGEGIQRLRYYAPAYGGMDVEAFVNQSIELLQALQTTEKIQDVGEDFYGLALPNIAKSEDPQL
jgi:uncharacterized protein